MNLGKNKPTDPNPNKEHDGVETLGISANSIDHNADSDCQSGASRLRDICFHLGPLFWLAIGVGLGFGFAFMCINSVSPS
jgi:hypothetical protein